MSTAQNRFASLVDRAEERLRDGDRSSASAIVAELRQMAAESDVVNELLCEDTPLCLRFDAVVAAERELR